MGYIALLISLYELFYAINYDLLMLFRRSIFSSMAPAPKLNTGNIALAETTSEASCNVVSQWLGAYTE